MKNPLGIFPLSGGIFFGVFLVVKETPTFVGILLSPPYLLQEEAPDFSFHFKKTAHF
jgi:hypothetical protein